MKVLLVEDNALTRNTIKALLAKLGHEIVAEAENGDKAVEQFAEFKPEVVFLDIILPGKSGLEVLDEILEIDPKARVVVITAVDQDEIDNRLYDKGVCAILRKPFSFDDFKVLMKDLAPTAAGRNLEAIAAASLERCAARLSRISSGKWSVSGIRVSQGSMEEIAKKHTVSGGAGFGVYFRVTGDLPFTSIIVFRQEDIGVLSLCFLGLTTLPGLSQAHELLFSELGNIILNSVISALSNKLKRGFLPSAPKSLQGEPRFLLEALWDTLEGGQRYSVAAITLGLNCGKDAARCEAVVVIPESLEKALASA
ncbi:MAG: response regulator [Elusimicrobia bacterium]|nr:response regulator [Elusimicrobiota bacterium]